MAVVGDGTDASLSRRWCQRRVAAFDYSETQPPNASCAQRASSLASRVFGVWPRFSNGTFVWSLSTNASLLLIRAAP